MSILQRRGSLFATVFALILAAAAPLVALAQAYPAPPQAAYPAPAAPQQTQQAFRIEETAFRVVRITFLRDGCLFQTRFYPRAQPSERNHGCGVAGTTVTFNGNAPPVLGWVAFRDCDEFRLVNPQSIPDVYGRQRGPCRNFFPVARKRA